MSTLFASTKDQWMNCIRHCSVEEFESMLDILPRERLPWQYLDRLDKAPHVVLLRATLLLWAAAEGAQVPREMQFRSMLAPHLGVDSLVCAGTGQGKTLAVVLNLLLDDPARQSITLMISPLQRLQATQEIDFSKKYGIRTTAINDQTPHSDEFWNENIFNLITRTPGTARLIISTVEQLFKTPVGHMPRLGLLVRDRRFQKYLERIYVDEAHFIDTAGLSRNGEKPFRPGWGRLDELKALLPSRIPWQAMSATFPPHILKTVVSKILRPNFITIQTPSNRPNTMYATDPITDSLDQMSNYDCFLTKPFEIKSQPRVLLFLR